MTAARRPDHKPVPNPLEDDPRDGVVDGLIAPGGKVDPDLIRAADESGEDEGARTVRFKLTRDLQKRLDKYLQDRVPFMSRTQLQRLIKEEAVTVNGRIPKPSTVLRLGDEVTVVVPPPPVKEIQPDDIPLDVLYEDDDLIVINKQPDLIVHPARSHKTGTLVNALAHHLQHRSSGALSNVGKEQARPGVVHRLDRYTSGVIVAAKTDVTHWRLGKQFANRTLDKRYLAVVHGRVEPVHDEISAPIGKHPVIRELQAVRYDESAKPAVTRYWVREQFDDYALLEVEPKTGRTHQLRVHLSYLGWPIVGDDLYGGRPLREADLASGGGDRMVIERQALHAAMLGFRHPRTNEPMRFTAPLWPDMRELLELLRAHHRVHGPVSPAGAMLDIDALIGA